MRGGSGAPPSVVVTSATINSGLAIIRALGSAGARVTGTDDRTLPLGLHSRHSAPYRAYPHPASGERFVAGMLEILRDVRPDVLLASGTPICAALSESRERFEALTALSLPDRASFRAAADNAKTLETCAALGIPAPLLLDEEQATRRLAKGPDVAGEPVVVVKPRTDVGAAQGVEYVRDRDGLSAALARCERLHGPALIQEYVPGPPDGMHTVVVLFDRESRLVAAFTMQKLRQWPTRGGNTAIAISTREPELLDAVRPLFEHWRWRGPAEVELKVDPRDGIARLIEVNPRFSGYVGFPVACGLNLPHLACRAALGERLSLPFPSYAVGTRYRNASLVAKSAWSELRAGRSPWDILGGLRRDLDGGACPNSRSLADPLPRLGKVLAELADLATQRRNGRTTA